MGLKQAICCAEVGVAAPLHDWRRFGHFRKERPRRDEKDIQRRNGERDSGPRKDHGRYVVCEVEKCAARCFLRNFDFSHGDKHFKMYMFS